MKQALRIAGKELRDVGREKSFLVAVTVQFLIAAFSTFLLFGLTGLYDPGSVTDAPQADVAYVGPGGFDVYLAAPNLRVVPLDEATAYERFEEGAVDIVVIETVPDHRRVSLLVPDGEVRSVLLVTQVQGLMEDYERDLRLGNQDRLDQEVLAIDTTIAPERPYSFIFATLLPLLVLAPVFISGAIAGDSFEQELQTRTHLLLRAAPLSPASILLGKLIVPVLLAPAQVLLWVLLLALNGIAVANVLWLLGITALLALLLAGIGLLVALIVRREHQTQEVYALVAILLGAASLFLPVDPLNLVARIAAGSAGVADHASSAIITLAAWLAVGAAAWLGERRMAA